MLKRCKRCIMPDTRPGSLFSDGVCQACLNYDKRDAIDWKERGALLAEICARHRVGSGYHCVVAVSGGKDSHVLTQLMAQYMDMRVLLVNVADPFTHTRAGIHNLRNLTDTFRCGLLTYTMPFPLFEAATRLGFEEMGEPLRLIESMIYTVPIVLAHQMGIGLLVYGEDSAYEYGTSCHEANALDMIQGSFKRAMQTDWGYPLPPMGWKLGMQSIEVIYGSHYMPWDGLHNYHIAKRHGFQSLGEEWRRAGYLEDYDQIDSLGYLVHLWMKYPKFGFARQTDILSRWIRRGRIDRSKALSLARSRDRVLDPQALEDFCSTLGYKTTDFWRIADRFYNRGIFEKKRGLWSMKQ